MERSERVISRLAVDDAGSAAPLVCKAGGAAAPRTDGFVEQCARWLTDDFESDRLARRWSALEAQAASEYDYFRLSDRKRRGLPMAPEMAAIEVQLDELSKQREHGFNAIAELEPRDIHEVCSLLIIAHRMNAPDLVETAPLMRKAIGFLSSSKCPGCGEPYVPTALPSA